MEVAMVTHPAAELFPMMSGGEFAALKEDIRQNGQRERALLFGGKVLDGRNRIKACEELGIKPDIAEIEECPDPVGFVLSKNLHRRHLTESQRAMIAAKVANIKREDTLKRGDSRSANLPNGAVTQTQAAELLNVSPRSVTAANRVRNFCVPEVQQAVERGELTVSRAAEIADLDEGEQVAAMEKGYFDTDCDDEQPQRTAHVGHNSGENEWYTPKEYIAAARECMGSIDLDPASSETANVVVGATNYFDEDSDGLRNKWSGNVWMNPPYAQPLMGQFAEKMAESVESGNVKAACVLVNNATETKWFQRMARVCSAICFPAGRVKFWHPDRESAPLQGQAVLYFGQNAEGFERCFASFGFVVTK